MSRIANEMSELNKTNPITWQAKNTLLKELVKLQPLFKRAYEEHAEYQRRENIGTEAVTDADFEKELICALADRYFEPLDVRYAQPADVGRKPIDSIFSDD